MHGSNGWNFKLQSDVDLGNLLPAAPGGDDAFVVSRSRAPVQVRSNQLVDGDPTGPCPG